MEEEKGTDTVAGLHTELGGTSKDEKRSVSRKNE